MGVFAQADTWEGEFSNPQTLNPYFYTLGNPLRFKDPSGHTSQESSDPVPQKPNDSATVVDPFAFKKMAFQNAISDAAVITKTVTDVALTAAATVDTTGTATLLKEAKNAVESALNGDVAGAISHALGAGEMLYHYSDDSGITGILNSEKILASEGETMWSVNEQGIHDAGVFNPDTNMGDRSFTENVFFTDIPPTQLDQQTAADMGIGGLHNAIGMSKPQITNQGIPVFQNPQHKNIFNAVAPEVKLPH